MKHYVNKNTMTWTLFAAVVFALIEGLILADILDSYYQVTLITICINIILALSLNLIIGYSGQFSLGHAGFMAIGAYCAALTLAKIPDLMGLLLGILIGIVISGVIALIIAIPTLRLRGDYLAIATLGFSEVIRIAILNMDVTGGAAGLSNIPKITTFPIIYIFILITLIVIVNFARSSHGRACASVREDEIASESMGVNTTKYKTLAFVIGAALASVGGALYAAYFYVINPGTFGFQKSIDILVIVVFGGMGSLTGSIVAAIILGFITLALQSFAELRMILYAVAIIVIMIYRPSGLFGNKELNITKLFKKKERKEAK